MVQETVNEDRPVRCNADCRIHVDPHHLIVMNNFHSSSAQYVRRTYHYGVADLVRDSDSLVSVDGHACFRHRDAQTVHHRTEVVSVFSKVDSLRCCTEDIYAVSLKTCSEVQRCLAAELRNNAERLFLLMDGENVFKCQRLKIELV